VDQTITLDLPSERLKIRMLMDIADMLGEQEAICWASGDEEKLMEVVANRDAIFDQISELEVLQMVRLIEYKCSLAPVVEQVVDYCLIDEVVVYLRDMLGYDVEEKFGSVLIIKKKVH
jgi:hypothetical protein